MTKPEEGSNKSEILLNHVFTAHQAGSISLILWILQENGLLGIGYGHCGSPRPYSAKSDKSKFGQKSIFAIFWGPNLAKNEVFHQNMQW